MNDFYRKNLRLACNTCPSVAQLCRSIGINRQQFNRYLAGAAKPSGYNATRIARYFGLEPTSFDLPSDIFTRLLAAPHQPVKPAGPLLHNTFPGNARRLRDYLGYYEVYHKSLSWPGMIVRSCSYLWNADNHYRVKTVEKMADDEQGIRQFTKYNGQVTFLRDRLFIIDRSSHGDPFIAQTILMPFGEHQRNYMTGITMGVAWRRGNQPYATRIVWRALGATPDLRQLLDNCRTLPENSSLIPPYIRRYLCEYTTDFITTA